MEQHVVLYSSCGKAATWHLDYDVISDDAE
jgi:hypothetical protein